MVSKILLYSRLSEYKAALLWAKRQISYALKPLGMELGECYLCGSLRYSLSFKRSPEKIARVIRRNLRGKIRDVATNLLDSNLGSEEYIAKMIEEFPEYRAFLEKVQYSDMDATIVVYKDGEPFGRWNLGQDILSLLDSVNDEVDKRFNIRPCYSAIELGWPMVEGRCTLIDEIPVLPSPKVMLMRRKCDAVVRFVEGVA